MIAETRAGARGLRIGEQGVEPIGQVEQPERANQIDRLEPGLVAALIEQHPGQGGCPGKRVIVELITPSLGASVDGAEQGKFAVQVAAGGLASERASVGLGVAGSVAGNVLNEARLVRH